MKRKSTSGKNKTRLVHITWLSVLVISIVLFAQCFEFTLVNQPTEGSVNSSFEVPIVLKQAEGQDFAYDLKDLGCFGVLLPEGWTVKDSIAYSVKGVYQDQIGPYDYQGWVVHNAEYAQMYEDSVGSGDGYYWWGGLSSDTAHVDNLDSISLTITIMTDDQEGTFELQYAIGTLDYWERLPVAAISDKMPITIAGVPDAVNNNRESKISVYPNPASELLNINLGDNTKGEVRMFDMSGRLQMSKQLNSKGNSFDISQFPEGTYIVNVKTDEDAFSQKVLIRK